MVDPLHVAWRALGEPNPDRPVQLTPGVCCRCGATGRGCHPTGTKGAVSDGFTEWDKLPWRELGTNFCVACTWGFRTAELRWYPHIVTPTATCRATPAQLRAALTAPLSTTVVCVPVSMQKHLLPWARWGTVTTDTMALPWATSEVTRFATYLDLRLLGFNGAAIGEPAPRFGVLRKLCPTQRARVLSVWATLDPWRERPAYLDVAARATRTPKETHAEPDPDVGG